MASCAQLSRQPKKSERRTVQRWLAELTGNWLTRFHDRALQHVPPHWSRLGCFDIRAMPLPRVPPLLLEAMSFSVLSFESCHEEALISIAQECVVAPRFQRALPRSSVLFVFFGNALHSHRAQTLPPSWTRHRQFSPVRPARVLLRKLQALQMPEAWFHHRRE